MAYAAGGDVFFQRFDPTGAPTGPAVLLATEGCNALDVIRAEGRWNVAWWNTDPVTGRARLRFQPVASDGSLIGAPHTFPLEGTGLIQLVHSPIGGYGVLETPRRNYRRPFFTVLGDLTSASLPVDVTGFDVSDAHAAGDPAGGFLVVYGGVSVRRIEPDGALLTPPTSVHSTTGTTLFHPRLVRHAGEWWVAYLERRSSSSGWQQRTMLGRGLSFTSPVVVDERPYPYSSYRSQPNQLRLVGAGPHLALAWEGWAGQIVGRRLRITPTSVAPLDATATWYELPRSNPILQPTMDLAWASPHHLLLSWVHRPSIRDTAVPTSMALDGSGCGP